jgi:hypothetical protein
MKYSMTLFLSFFVLTIGQSQTNSINPSGPVGIGTTTPSFDLDINSTLPYIRIHSSVYTNNPAVLTKKGGIIFNHENGDKTAAISGAVPPGYHVPGILFSTKTAWNLPNGNIGVGILNPLNTLHVSGSIGLDGNASLPTNAEASNSGNYVNNYNFKLSNSNNGLYITLSNTFNERKTFIQSGHTDSNYAFGLGPIILNPFGGNIGIGTGSSNPDAKLTVAGDIHSREVRVTINAGSDFVFEEEYDLRPLNELEDFLKKHKHLPGIESAKEMEEKGVELGKMDMKLLQKIEELTLYMIDFDKEMDSLKEENQKLKAEIAKLKKR